MPKKDLISVGNLSPQEVEEIFLLTDKLKADAADFKSALAGKTLALIFQKPSNRTRVSFDVGMYQLGGNSVYLSPGEINLGVRESISDAAKTLSRYVDGIVLRTFEHKNVLELAKYAEVPVINGLSDFSHPCQALADIYTIREKLGALKGKTLAYVGDGNNVCNSLLYACARVSLNMNTATPKGYEPDGAVFESARATAFGCGAKLQLTHSPQEAVAGVDVIYTDVWASMGQEKEAAKREKAFKDFQVNAKLLKLAKKGALIMHCLPAHRGKEITEDVIDGKNSVVFDQAENRLHVQKAVLIKLLGNRNGR
ncbi:MAG: ornithine carbamoyltransferase [Candidatus Omnitrophota bacterium]|nr:ornithine carbamoyltransferase [Candidatus Omnitrophota bacterium]